MEDNNDQKPQPAEIPQTESKDDTSTSSKKRHKLLLPLIAVAILVLGAGAAAYNAIVLQDPERIWAKALETTEEGLKDLIEAAREQEAEGGIVDGAIKVSGPIVADGSVTGQWYGSSSQFSADLGVSGVRVNAELITVAETEEVTPDAYLKLDGLNSISSLLGLALPGISEVLSSVDDTWLKIDRTLIEQTSSSGQIDEAMLSEEEIDQTISVIGDVLQNRVFTDDESQAVFVVQEYIGEEDFEGVGTYKYLVRVQKEQLKAMIADLAAAVDNSPLGQYVQSIGDESLAQTIDTESLFSSIDELDESKLVADVWIDTKTKLFRNIRISVDDDGGQSYIDLGIPFDGGDAIPFVFKIVANGYEAPETNGEAAFRIELNRDSSSVKLAFDIDIEDSVNGEFEAEAELMIQPSDEPIDVQAPESSTNILELYGLLGSGLLNGLPQDPTLFDDQQSIELLETLEL